MPTFRNRLLYSLIAILVLLLVAAGYYLVKSPLSPIQQNKFVDGTIIFSGLKNGSSGAMTLFSLSKGGKVAELSSSSFTDALNATFSPDLTKIAYVAVHDGKQVIATVNVDGSGAQQISKLDGPKTMPSWSKDGKKILYALSRQGGGVAEIDLGTNSDQVVSVGTDLVQTPVWLPDGSGFVYMALDVDQAAGTIRSHLKEYKGGASAEVKLTGDKNVVLSDFGSISVSADGKQIALVRRSDNRIYIAGTDGNNLRLLTKSGSSLYSCPSWSPDGSFVLAAESDSSGKYYISKIGTSDGSVTRSDLSGYSKINCPRMVRY